MSGRKTKTQDVAPFEPVWGPPNRGGWQEAHDEGTRFLRAPDGAISIGYSGRRCIQAGNAVVLFDYLTSRPDVLAMLRAHAAERAPKGNGKPKSAGKPSGVVDFCYQSPEGVVNPATKDELQTLIDKGYVEADTLVGKRGLPRMMLAREIADVADMFRNRLPMA